jgi:hypothetical protein
MVLRYMPLHNRYLTLTADTPDQIPHPRRSNYEMEKALLHYRKAPTVYCNWAYAIW